MGGSLQLMRGKTAMIFRGPRPLVDRPTQALVLFGAVNIGLIAAFGFDSLRWLGHWELPMQYLIGVAGIWQLLRQRW
jgi:uncharacterized membrane protein YuzA (DUF378 family)